MRIISDLQLHSKYARAVSQEMVIPKIWEWAKRKGIGLIATGDWTHPLWMREIKNTLIEAGNGLLKLKTPIQSGPAGGDGPQFLLETEVSCIYSQGGKLRRIHTLIWSPSIVTSEKINKALMDRGANLMSDGRPIMGLTSIQIAEVVFSIDPKCLIIPAHIWTPWFSLYGSESGFDSLNEAYGNYSRYIYAVETGLSSNPAMNWRIKELDSRAVVSFSDAHSGPKLGREATVFDLNELSFKAISEALKNPSGHPAEPDLASRENKIAYSIEFYPEEGKYHYTGHRNCQVKQSPEETRTKGTVCPVCGRKLTIGVMHRVDQLATRSEKDLKMQKKNLDDILPIAYYSQAIPARPPYIMLVPLLEIIAEAIHSRPVNKNVQNEYFKLTDHFQTEFNVLLTVPVDAIVKISGENVAKAIDKVRTGDIVVDPGYDGVFGIVKIWNEEKNEIAGKSPKEQMSLF